MKKVTSFLVMVLVATTLTSVSFASHNKEKEKIPKIEKSDFVVSNDLVNVSDVNETCGTIVLAPAYFLVNILESKNDVSENIIMLPIFSKWNVASENSIRLEDPLIDPGSNSFIKVYSDYQLNFMLYKIKVRDIPNQVNFGRDIDYFKYSLVKHTAFNRYLQRVKQIKDTHYAPVA